MTKISFFFFFFVKSWHNYYEPGTDLGTRGKAVNRTDQNPFFHRAYILKNYQYMLPKYV